VLNYSGVVVQFAVKLVRESSAKFWKRDNFSHLFETKFSHNLKPLSVLFVTQFILERFYWGLGALLVMLLLSLMVAFQS